MKKLLLCLLTVSPAIAGPGEGYVLATPVIYEAMDILEAEAARKEASADLYEALMPGAGLITKAEVASLRRASDLIRLAATHSVRETPPMPTPVPVPQSAPAAKETPKAVKPVVIVKPAIKPVRILSIFNRW